MMAFSSNPAVREVQNGVSFAFRPIQGALDGAAGSVASVAAAIAEIDRLRVDNAALRAENERLDDRERPARGDPARERLADRRSCSCAPGFDYKTAAATVIARESSEFRRLVVLDKGTDDGIAVGDVAVAAGGALAGRVTEVGPDSAKVVLLTDGESTVIGQLTTNAATGEVVGQLGGVLIMRQIDSGDVVAVGDEVVTAGIELGGGVRSPYPKGLLIGQVVDVRRDANDVVQTAFLQPAAQLDKLEYLLVITDYQGGLPPIEQQPVDCGDGGTLPAGRAAVPRRRARRRPAPRRPAPKP